MNQDSGAMHVIKQPAIHVLLIVLVGVAVYSGTFHVPFDFDDIYSITDNPLIKNIDNFISRPDGYSTYPNRYIGYLTFALNYRFTGLDVKSYHIVNLAIHLINALLVYLLIILTFKTKCLKDSYVASSAAWIAFISSVLFLVHPIETQAVTYTVQRLASLAVLFYLASLVFFVKARFALERERPRVAVVIFYMLSLLSATLAMKTKEIAFTLPLITLLYEFFFFKGQIKNRLLFLLPILSTLFIIPVSMISIQEPAGHLLSDISKAARLETILPRWDYLLTQFSVIVTYIRLIILPINQNLDYDYPIFHSFLEPRVYGSFFVLACLLGVAVYLFMRSRKGGNPALRLVSFGILWFFITLSVESSVIPILDVIYEHRTYLPSIGLFITFASVGVMASRKYRAATKLLVVIAVSTVLALSILTYERNTVWASDISLWEDVVRKSPGKARPHDNLGVAYRDKGWVDKALEEYQLALKADLAYELAHKHLGEAYDSKGLFDKAIDEYKLALQLDPNDEEAHHGLGDVYFDKGWVDGAIAEYQLAVKIKPDYEDVHNQLGLAYGSKGLVDKEIEEYNIALTLSPGNADFHYNLGKAFIKKGLTKEGNKEIERAAQLHGH